MKIKHIILASAVLVSVSSFAQKDELKKLKKIYEKDEIKGNDLAEYKALVNKVEPLATEESDKIYASLYLFFVMNRNKILKDIVVSTCKLSTGRKESRPHLSTLLTWLLFELNEKSS